MNVVDHPIDAKVAGALPVGEFSSARYRDIIGCVVAASLGILVLDVLTLTYGVYYPDDINVLHPVAVRSVAESLKFSARPLEYFIVSAANDVYLPLWLAASLLCVAGAAVLAGLACEKLLEQQLPRAGWWILGLADPLLFYLVSQPDTLSQGLSNLLFAGAMLAFASEWRWRPARQPSTCRDDGPAVVLNLLAAALFFTKETAVAAAVLLPAAAALVRLRERRFSPVFLFSLLFPAAGAIGWLWIKLQFPVMLPTLNAGHYALMFGPAGWAQNFIITLAFPLTPLPSSFLGFALLRLLWIAVALGAVALFLAIVWYEVWRQPKIALPLLLIAACCAPMILVKPSELYSTMIAPFAIAIILLFGVSRAPRVSWAYGLLLYGASLANGAVYFNGGDFKLFGMQHIQYSIYDKYYQSVPICPIGGTAHFAWDRAASGHYLGVPGRPVCVRH